MFLFVLSSLVINTEKFINENNIEVIKRAARTDDIVQFKVSRTGVHLSATDVPAIFPSAPTLLRRGFGFMDKMEPAVVMTEINSSVHTWFKKNVC